MIILSALRLKGSIGSVLKLVFRVFRQDGFGGIRSIAKYAKSNSEFTENKKVYYSAHSQSNVKSQLESDVGLGSAKPYV